MAQIDPNAKKSISVMVIIVACMLAIGGIFIVFLANKTSQNKATETKMPQSDAMRDTRKKTEGTNIAGYDNLAVTHDNTQASNAVAGGQSFVPAFAPPAVEINPAPVVTAQSATQQFAPNGTVPGFVAAGQPGAAVPKTQEQIQSEQTLQEETKNLVAERQRVIDAKLKMVDEMKGPFASEGFSQFVVATYKPKESDLSKTNGTGVGGKTDPNANKKIFIKSGAKAFVSIDTAINTDEPSPVLGTVLTGPASGMTLFGKAVHNPDDTVSISFNQLNMKDGSSIAINAFALDPETGRTAVVGAVDHKIFQRFVLPAIAGAGTMVAQVEAQNGMQMQSAPLSGMATTTYNPSPTQIEAAAIGAGLGSLSNNLNAIASAAQPAVSTQRNLGLEIVFMKEVMIQK